MNKRQDSFETRLENAFAQHKKRHGLNWREKLTLRGVLRNDKAATGPSGWQGGVALVGLCLLAVLLFQQHSAPEAPHFYRVELTDFRQLESNDIVDDKYVMTDTLLQADEELRQALLANRHHHARFGTLVRVDESWYIAACHNRVLIEVKQSLLQELGRKNALPSKVRPGEQLILERNPAGEIIALNRVEGAALQCRDG